MSRLGEVAIGVQDGVETVAVGAVSLDDAALAPLSLDAAPQDGDVFTLTVRCVASHCQVVTDGERDRWSGVLTIAPLSIVKDGA